MPALTVAEPRQCLTVDLATWGTMTETWAATTQTWAGATAGILSACTIALTVANYPPSRQLTTSD